MAVRRSRMGAGHSRELWPVLLLLLSAVIVPTACVLWFMTQAMRNERLAVRQKLEVIYRRQLVTVREQLDDYWARKLAGLAEVDPETPAPEAFARLVNAGVADSVVLCDGAGRLRYPDLPEPGAEVESAEWQRAEQLEYGEAKPAEAAAIYAGISRQADHADNANLAARALIAQARCLAKSGQREAAVNLLIHTLADPKYRNATDPLGRLIVPNVWLYALELIGEASRPEFGRTAERLRQRLVDYRDPALPATQRRFLMEQLTKILPAEPRFPTLDAEILAADYVETRSPPPRAAHLVRSSMDKVWQLASPGRTVVALFDEGRLVADMRSATPSSASLAEARVTITPAAAYDEGEPFLAMSAGKFLPDWQLSVYLQGPNPFAAAAEKRIAAYLWTGLLVVFVLAGLVILIARYLGRQVKLTRLKNDLIATVSHELKTPLSSIRVLVDTLLDNDCRDETQTREYLALIAKENLRLSRLIDNFLTFSRMERNKRTFESCEVAPDEVVSEAVEAVRDRFEIAGFKLDVHVTQGLPPIVGDSDALVTVIINLLDNAMKYSKNDKRVEVRVREADGEVYFDVEDHGVGLSRRETRRIFDRFYQADQSLSRETGGCGLGLSIVSFIVDAHGGSIRVDSQPGKGSTFTVRLPAAAAARNDRG